jgi:FkbM family methyltransferase
MAHKLDRWQRGIRNGVSPVAMLRHRITGDDRARFRGVSLEAPDPKVVWDTLSAICCEGEYDYPGFVPRRGWRVIDIGANIGIFAMLAASRGAHVVSYEPHPDSFKCLQANTAKWGVDCRRTAVVGDPVDAVKLFVHPGRSTRHSLLGRDISSGSVLEHSVEVPAITLAQVLEDPVDLLKIDCEGAEFAMLRACRSELRTSRRIIAEIHRGAGDPEEILTLVQEAGFAATLHESHADENATILTSVRE